MKLKKVIICGFKSFADKTEFEFGDGVTVVVGPNGCGKSNVVDAIKWVLGEQSAKSLRGGQMLDVIFNGTSSRKSMSYAEVSLVFSNNNRLINVDQDEISVTRKLFRSGDSEYLINGKAARLKDIREMFMDTGIGADAYSIIEQGKVESLLQASKEDRRAIFEEAAGISKYKARKKEALRKLERTEQNLLRLNDIIAELEKRLRSIRYQAGKARNYQAYAARLRELRLNQFLAEYHQFQQEAKDGAASLTTLQDELVGVTTEGDRVQAQLSELDHLLERMERDIHAAENQVLQCTSQISNQQDRIEMGRRRSEELQQLLERSSERLAVLRQQITQLQQQLAADQQEIDASEGELTGQQEQLRQIQEVRQQHALKLNEHRAQLEDEKSGLVDIVRRTAQSHNEISSLNLRRDSLSGQKDRLSNRSGQISAEVEKLLTDRAQFDGKLKDLRQLLEDSQAQLEEKRHQLAQLSEEKLTCSENLATAKEHRSGLLSRRQLLADLEAKLEGVDVGVRQVLQKKKQDANSFYYIKGMVAELFRADVKYAAAVENALAERAQHLVVTSSQAVLEDAAHLAELKGRVKLLCQDQLPPFSDGYDFSPHPEVKARLIDLIEYAPDNESMAWHLLGKTVLVDTLAAALRLIGVVPRGYRFVTLQGEVLEADGTLHLGPQATQTGLISRKSQLRELDRNITEADEMILTLQHQAEQFVSQTRHLEKNLQDLRTVIYETRTEEVENRSRLEQVDQNVNRLKQEQPLIVSEIVALEHQIEEGLRQQASSEQRLLELQTINQEHQERVNVLESQIEALTQEDQQLLDQITELKVQLGQIQQKRVALKEKYTSRQMQLRQAEHNLQSLETDLANARENLAASQRAILTAENAIAELFQQRQEWQNQTGQLRAAYEQHQADKQQKVDQARQLRQRRDQLTEQLHTCQMRLNETRLRIDNIHLRAREELQLDMEESYRTYQYEQVDFTAISTEVEDLRGKIERLGNINLDAIAEQEELEKRAEYLNTQLTDLNESKRNLEQLIAKINEESVELFRSNFETIKVNFSELFRKLFGGGRAEIILEDPNNILECGIEIVARPPGKQLQSISLLSGGEKTMTAVALLLAIFKSKPSPFCLLDEVDAALDEANTERFNLVVREFIQESQFIIITHARRTMSIADVIFGVTMQEQGVSKKVSVRFSGSGEPVSEGDAAVASAG